MNRILDDIQPSATLVLAAKAKELKASGKDVLGFTAGEPDFSTPKHVCEAAKAAIDNGEHQYSPVAGIPALKNAIVQKFKRENNLEYSTDEVMVSAGGKQAIYNFLFVACNPGDEVIILSPYWLSFPEQVRLCGMKPVIVSSLARISENITEKTKAIILNSPCNPTGGVLSREELETIAALAKEHDLLVLSDEVYEHFLYKGKHESIASLIQERTLVVNAVSKTYAMTGWRLGYCAGPKSIIKAMTTFQSHTTSGPSSITQHAAVAALTGPQDSVQEMNEAFAKRRELIMRGVEEAGLPYVLPDGAFYLFVDISKTGLTSEEFSQRLLEEELVAVIPGKPFGSDKHIRFSYATDEETIKKGMVRLKHFLESL